MTRRFANCILCLLALLLLTGCRTRTVSDPARADVVQLSTRPEPPAPEQPPAETPPEPDPEPEPEPEPEPDPAPAPDEAAEESRPDLADSLTETGAPTLREERAAGVTVTYDANGGDSASVSTVVTPGEPYGRQPEPTRRAHSFIGWYTAPGGGARVTADTLVTETASHTLYAHWEARSGSVVTFDGNGGRVKSREAKLTLTDGDLFGPLPTPLREGYEFLGWYTAPDGGDAVTPESVFADAGDLTLYAHWEYDAFAFWSFTLSNRTQQVYLCQQVSIYFEEMTDHQTRQSVALISATGSQNVAENRADPSVTDDWVLAKKPGLVLKCVADAAALPAARDALVRRFPAQEYVFAAPAALGTGAEGLYARLALAKHLYGDWYLDVDLALVAAELGVTAEVIWF